MLIYNLREKVDQKDKKTQKKKKEKLKIRDMKEDKKDIGYCYKIKNIIGFYK